MARISRASLVKLGTVMLVVFAQGIPNSFIQNALPIIYRTQGLGLDQFWLFSLPLVPRWIKWLIAPLVDNYSLLPIGRRRSWILVGTLVGSLGYASLAVQEPTLSGITVIIGILFVAELIMAVQDVAVDGYCVEALGAEEAALAGPALSVAHIMSFFVASAVVMVCYQYYGWQAATLLTAGLLIVCTIPVLLQPEPIADEVRQRSANRHGRPSLRSVLSRPIAIYLLGVVAISGIYSSFSYNVFSVMLVDKGMTVGQIGIASGSAVTVGALIGAGITAWLMHRFSFKQVTLLCCFTTAFAHLTEVFVASQATMTVPLAMATYFVAEVAISPYFALMSAARLRWTSKRQAGTDFTLQSSVRSVAMFIASAASGPVAGAMGWTAFYTLAIFLGIGATMAIYLVHDRMEANREAEEADLDAANAVIDEQERAETTRAGLAPN